MKFNYFIPENVEKFIKDAKLEEISIGCSDSQVVRIKNKEGCFYLKIMKENLLLQEYKRLSWLQGKLPVPKVVMYIQESGNDYLITEETSGKMLCDEEYTNNPDIALSVLKDAFHKIHSVDITNCPFDVSNDYKLSLIEKNVKNNLVNTSSLKDETRKKFGSAENLLKYLKENKFEEELVFSHGDTSLPNIFGKNKNFIGFIDVGECGIADKWFDLAICEKSILRNYGQEYVEQFYRILNIKREDNKVNYYLLMMELYL